MGETTILAGNKRVGTVGGGTGGGEREVSADPFQRLQRERCLVLVAHPDDESIGLGALLSRMRDVDVVCVTDGAPASGDDPARQAVRRRAEWHRALDVAEIPRRRRHLWNEPDQSLGRGLRGLTERIREALARFRSRLVITHPYEGGHPDHDSLHLALWAAVRDSSVERWEFAGYHRHPESLEMRTGRFLPAAGPEFRHVLQAAERERKQAMFACYESQRDVLRYFAVDDERVRPCPVHDFRLAPHEGLLFYEQFCWGWSGVQWRQRAAELLDAIGKPEHGDAAEDQGEADELIAGELLAEEEA